MPKKQESHNITNKWFDKFTKEWDKTRHKLKRSGADLSNIQIISKEKML